jgi:hypothetical protein
MVIRFSGNRGNVSGTTRRYGGFSGTFSRRCLCRVSLTDNSSMVSHEALDFTRRQLIRLRAFFQRNGSHAQALSQHRRDEPRTVSSRLIAIEHQYGLIKMAGKEVRLSLRQGGSHQGDDGQMAGLMRGEGIEEAFDHDDRGRLCSDRTM